MSIPPATHVFPDGPNLESLADDLDRFYGLDLIDCPRCHGSGEIQFNLSRNRDPQCDDNALCNVCHGDGMVHPDDLHNENESPGAVSPARGATHQE